MTKLSSAGLVYKHYGKELLRILGAKEAEIDFLHQELYLILVESIDANDNGVKQCSCLSTPSAPIGMNSIGSLLVGASSHNPEKMDEDVSPFKIVHKSVSEIVCGIR